jgi:hypothetical protein
MATAVLTFQLLLGVTVRLTVLVCHWTKRIRKEDANVSVRNRPKISSSEGVFCHLLKCYEQTLSTSMALQTSLALGKIVTSSNITARHWSLMCAEPWSGGGVQPPGDLKVDKAEGAREHMAAGGCTTQAQLLALAVPGAVADS